MPRRTRLESLTIYDADLNTASRMEIKVQNLVDGFPGVMTDEVPRDTIAVYGLSYS